MKIEIKQKHIDLGKRGDMKRCPVALAIRDMGMECESASCTMIIGGKSGKNRIKVDYHSEIGKFIRCFDSDGAKGLAPGVYSTKVGEE